MCCEESQSVSSHESLDENDQENEDKLNNKSADGAAAG